MSSIHISVFNSIPYGLEGRWVFHGLATSEAHAKYCKGHLQFRNNSNINRTGDKKNDRNDSNQCRPDRHQK